MRGPLTSVDDPDRVGHGFRHVGLHPRPQFVMDLLGLRARYRHQRERETMRESDG